MKKNEIETAFDEAVKFREVYLRTLDEYIRLKVYELAQEIRSSRAKFVLGSMELNPDYKYPAEYLPNRQFEYWEDHDTTSRNAIQVINSFEKIGEKTVREEKEPLTFIQYLKSDNNVVLAEKLRKEFNTETGRDIRFIIDILRDKGLLEYAELKPLIEAMAEYFNREIGTYESIRKTNYIPTMHKFYYKKISDRIENILN